VAALAVSIGLHLLASFVVPPLDFERAPLAPPLEVVLLENPAPRADAVEKPAAVALEKPPPAERPLQPAIEPEVTPRKPPARVKPAPAPRRPERARARRPDPPVPPAPTQPTPSPDVATPDIQAPEPPPTSAIAQAPETPRSVTEPSPPIREAVPPTSGGMVSSSPELLANYGKTISELLARHREYPRIALARGWEGLVTMRLHISPDGKLVDAFVQESSGYEVLDAQALAMLKQVRALPAPPAALRDREFAVLVPVVFRLQR
jgi:protein TonB